jgi:hypothetical protein
LGLYPLKKIGSDIPPPSGANCDIIKKIMSDEPHVRLIPCLMDSTQALKIREMVGSHDEFLGIEVDVDPNLQANKEVSVTFRIPENINTVNFFGEFTKALSQESTAVTLNERMR